MSTIREPAVAGLFYPDEPRQLRAMVNRFIEDVTPPEKCPRALVAPHAGYVYSGPVAGTAYAPLARGQCRAERVILLGPSHRVPFRGLALSSATDFSTPLGPVPVDQEACRRAGAFPQVQVLDAAHAMEHSLEVHLPFLQVLLGDFALVPLVVGDAGPTEVSEVLEALWDAPEKTLVVISSDLSHYHDYDTARRLDSETSRDIEALNETLTPEQACGCRPLNGLLHLARTRGMNARTLDLRNSGDTAGPRDRVVGYGAYGIT